MGVLKACGFALAAAMLAFALKAGDRQLSLCLSLAAGAMLLLTALTYVGRVVEVMRRMSESAGLKEDSLALVVRLIGMAYVTEFGVQACNDAEETGLAQKLSLCGRAAMAAMTMPLLMELNTLVLSLLP